MNVGLQARKTGVPAPLLNMAGITVTVDPGHPGTEAAAGESCEPVGQWL